jgi:hypothetical protein
VEEEEVVEVTAAAVDALARFASAAEALPALPLDAGASTTDLDARDGTVAITSSAAVDGTSS